jgi:hypothetical protein
MTQIEHMSQLMKLIADQIEDDWKDLGLGRQTFGKNQVLSSKFWKVGSFAIEYM